MMNLHVSYTNIYFYQIVKFEKSNTTYKYISKSELINKNELSVDNSYRNKKILSTDKSSSLENKTNNLINSNNNNYNTINNNNSNSDSGLNLNIGNCNSNNYSNDNIDLKKSNQFLHQKRNTFQSNGNLSNDNKNCNSKINNQKLDSISLISTNLNISEINCNTPFKKFNLEKDCLNLKESNKIITYKDIKNENKIKEEDNNNQISQSKYTN
jgi:hypothetical protein